jgi:hypothetical protein
MKAEILTQSILINSFQQVSFNKDQDSFGDKNKKHILGSPPKKNIIKSNISNIKNTARKLSSAPQKVHKNFKK